MRVVPTHFRRIIPAINCCAPEQASVRRHSQRQDSRRQVLFGLTMTMTMTVAGMGPLAAGQRAVAAEEDSTAASPSPDSTAPAPPPASQATFKTLRDPTLAYSFEYPVTTASGVALPMVMSRKPEKYSSAAPLTADARQRIVSELVSLQDAVTVSVSVGPPSGTLVGKDSSAWTARELAEQVLLDRSTGRITSGQRISLSTVEEAGFVEKGGVRYCVYEHVSQGSPTLLSSSGTTYRHARAVTVMREGLEGAPYLYTLNVSCPQARWEDLEGPFMRAVESFTLEAPGSGFVQPNEAPWMFF